MKHIKLLSALTLSASLLTVASGAVSAAVVTSPGNTAIEKTTGGAGFAVDKTTPIVPELPPSKGGGTDSKNPGDKTTPDGGGTLPSASDLALYYAPKEFNFGVQKVSASDKLKGVTMTQKKWLAGNNDADGNSKDKNDEYAVDYQTVRVSDGRAVNDGWAVSVSATPFTEGAKTLTGATIKIADAKAETSDATGKVAGKAAFDIATNGSSTVDILKADSTARFQSFLSFDVNKVTLDIPGSAVTTGNFSSTVTWTLTGTPDV